MSRTIYAYDVAPYLLTLANRNDPICVMHRYRSYYDLYGVMSLKVAKASTTRVAVAGVIAGIFALTFVN